MGKLTGKQTRFVDEYLELFDATKAASRAGYNECFAETWGRRCLENPRVTRAMAAALEERSANHGLSEGWVLTRLKENVEVSMGHLPIPDGDGNSTGKYAYNGPVANRGLELIGKHIGMFSNSQSAADKDDETSSREGLMTLGQIFREPDELQRVDINGVSGENLQVLG